MSGASRGAGWWGCGGGAGGGCCDDAGVAGRRRRRQQSREARQRGLRADGRVIAVGSSPDAAEAPSGGGDDERLDAAWEDSRSGAWSGRGFSFQYAVGAWLTAGVGSGLISAVVVPEGFEDVSLEGLEDGASLHVQAKSRGEASGLFPVQKAVDHILKSWQEHIHRAEPGARLAVVLERGVDGETLPSGLATSAPTLSESLQDDSRLLSRLRKRCAHRGMSVTDVDRLLSSVVVVGVTWDEVTNETAACVDAVTDLPPSSLRMAAHLLVGIVARASAENASSRMLKFVSLGWLGCVGRGWGAGWVCCGGLGGWVRVGVGAAGWCWGLCGGPRRGGGPGWVQVVGVSSRAMRTRL